MYCKTFQKLFHQKRLKNVILDSRRKPARSNLHLLNSVISFCDQTITLSLYRILLNPKKISMIISFRIIDRLSTWKSAYDSTKEKITHRIKKRYFQ